MPASIQCGYTGYKVYRQFGPEWKIAVFDFSWDLHWLSFTNNSCDPKAAEANHSTLKTKIDLIVYKSYNNCNNKLRK